MTREEIQSVIDKGGWITDGRWNFKPSRIVDEYVEDGNCPFSIGGLGYPISCIDNNCREATPEEIAKYVKEEKV